MMLSIIVLGFVIFSLFLSMLASSPKVEKPQEEAPPSQFDTVQ